MAKGIVGRVVFGTGVLAREFTALPLYSVNERLDTLRGVKGTVPTSRNREKAFG